jgi:hypothetical protein
MERITSSMLHFSTALFQARAGVAQSVQCLVTDWTTGRSRFDPRHRKMIFPVASVFSPSLGPTQPPVQGVLGVLSAEENARPGSDADHSPPSSAEVVNEQELYFLPPAPTQVCCGTSLPLPLLFKVLFLREQTDKLM